MLSSVQAARALAALSVAAFHLSLMMGDPRYGGVPVFQEYTIEGNLGVDFFFVLSGFIILHAHAKDIGQPSALPNYLWRRWARLFPVYWIYTAGMTMLLLLGLGANTELPDSLTEWLATITLIRFSPIDPPLRVSWTLFHELAFYLAFAVLIVHRKAGIALFAGWATVCLLFFHHVGLEPNTPWHVYTAQQNLYFLMGMGSFLLMRRGGRWWPELLGGLLVVAVVVAFWPPMGSHAGELPLVVGFALLLAGVTKLEQRKNLPLPRWLLTIGDSSYSLYLLHLPICGLLLKLAFAAELPSYIGGSGVYLAVLGGAVLLSVATYYAVEAPLLRRLRRVEVRPARRTERGSTGPKSGAPMYRG